MKSLEAEMIAWTAMNRLSRSRSRLSKRREFALLRHARTHPRLATSASCLTGRIQRDEMAAIEATRSRNANPASRSPL
jgi:hypothetical protein